MDHTDCIILLMGFYVFVLNCVKEIADELFKYRDVLKSFYFYDWFMLWFRRIGVINNFYSLQYYKLFSKKTIKSVGLTIYQFWLIDIWNFNKKV